MKVAIHHAKVIFTILFEKPKHIFFIFFGIMILQLYWRFDIVGSNRPSDLLSLVLNGYIGAWMLCVPFLMEGAEKQKAHGAILLPTIPLRIDLRILIESLVVLFTVIFVRLLIWAVLWGIVGYQTPFIQGLLPGFGKSFVSLTLVGAVVFFPFFLLVLSATWIHRYGIIVLWTYLLLWGGGFYFCLKYSSLGFVSIGLIFALFSLLVVGFRWENLALKGKFFSNRKISLSYRMNRPFQKLFFSDLFRDSGYGLLLFAVLCLAFSLLGGVPGLGEASFPLALVFPFPFFVFIVVRPSWKKTAFFHTDEKKQRVHVSPVGAANLVPLSKQDLFRDIYFHGLLSGAFFWLLLLGFFLFGIWFHTGFLMEINSFSLFWFLMVPIFVVVPSIAAALVYSAAVSKKMLLSIVVALILIPQLGASNVARLSKFSVPDIPFWSIGLAIVLVGAASCRLPHYLRR